MNARGIVHFTDGHPAKGTRIVLINNSGEAIAEVDEMGAFEAELAEPEVFSLSVNGTEICKWNMLGLDITSGITFKITMPR